MDESYFKGTYVCFPNLTLTDLITDKVQLVRIVIFECSLNQLDMSLYLLYYLCNNDCWYLQVDNILGKNCHVLL